MLIEQLKKKSGLFIDDSYGSGLFLLNKSDQKHVKTATEFRKMSLLRNHKHSWRHQTETLSSVSIVTCQLKTVVGVEILLLPMLTNKEDKLLPSRCSSSPWAFLEQRKKARGGAQVGKVDQGETCFLTFAQG